MSIISSTRTWGTEIGEVRLPMNIQSHTEGYTLCVKVKNDQIKIDRTGLSDKEVYLKALETLKTWIEINGAEPLIKVASDEVKVNRGDYCDIAWVNFSEYNPRSNEFDYNSMEIRDVWEGDEGKERLEEKIKEAKARRKAGVERYKEDRLEEIESLKEKVRAMEENKILTFNPGETISLDDCEYMFLVTQPIEVRQLRKGLYRRSLHDLCIKGLLYHLMVEDKVKPIKLEANHHLS